MAQYTAVRSDSRTSISTALSHRQFVLAIPASGISNADNIEVHGFMPGIKGIIHRVKVRQGATLGASATILAQINNAGTRTALTAATAAGSANNVDSDGNANAPFALSGGEVLELLVGGANISAAATVTVDLYVSARP